MYTQGPNHKRINLTLRRLAFILQNRESLKSFEMENSNTIFACWKDHSSGMVESRWKGARVSQGEIRGLSG